MEGPKNEFYDSRLAKYGPSPPQPSPWQRLKSGLHHFLRRPPNATPSSSASHHPSSCAKSKNRDECETKENCFWDPNHQTCEPRPAQVFDARAFDARAIDPNFMDVLSRPTCNRILHVDLKKWAAVVAQGDFVFPWVITAPSYFLSSVLTCTWIGRYHMNFERDDWSKVKELLHSAPFTFAIVNINVRVEKDRWEDYTIYSSNLSNLRPSNHSMAMFLYRKDAASPWRVVTADPNYDKVRSEKTWRERSTLLSVNKLCLDIAKLLTSKVPEKIQHMMCFNSNVCALDGEGVCFAGPCLTLLAALLLKDKHMKDVVEPARNGLELMKRIIWGSNVARLQGHKFMQAALRQLEPASFWHYASPAKGREDRSRSPRRP